MPTDKDVKPSVEEVVGASQSQMSSERDLSLSRGNSEPSASVGFTGTREGLTQAQVSSLIAWLKGRPPGVFHHGDCIGADGSAHAAAKHRGWRIEAHPGTGPRFYAVGCAKVHPVKPNLERNSDIVAVADELLACPLAAETLRSGTWSTVRKARRKGITITIFWPNGSVTVEPASAERLGEAAQVVASDPG